jgi:hypothetical protein
VLGLQVHTASPSFLKILLKNNTELLGVMTQTVIAAVRRRRRKGEGKGGRKMHIN